MRLDLVTWLEFLNHYNGKTLFPERLWVSNDTLQFFTDSAGGRSGGLVYFFTTGGLLVNGLNIGWTRVD